MTLNLCSIIIHGLATYPLIYIAIVGGNTAIGVEAARDGNDTLWRQPHPVRVVVDAAAVHLLCR